MNKNQFYAGIGSMGIAAVLYLLNLTFFETKFGETFLASIKLYPAAFFALLGLLLIFMGLKPLLKKAR
jgi:hypothetical protein